MDKFIREINKYKNFLCGISSNLSHKDINLEKIFIANPRSLRISLSGFFESSSKQTHTRGNIDLVKSNMLDLKNIIDKHDLKTKVSVAYHVYKHNAGNELLAMKNYCDELGFSFNPNWANFHYRP